MKKKQRVHLTIQPQTARPDNPRIFPGFLCAFLLLSFSCGSFFLNFSLIFSPGFTFAAWAGPCILLGISGALVFALGRRPGSFRLVLGSLGLLLFALYLCREDFFIQLRSAAGAVESRFHMIYGLSPFPGYIDRIRDKWTLCFFLAAFYLFLILLVMRRNRRGLFVLLLGLPIAASYLMKVTEPLWLFALPFGAFLFWKGALNPRSLSRLWIFMVPCQGLLFLAAACLLTPLFSPLVFSSSHALSARVNELGSRIFSSEEPEPSSREDPLSSLGAELKGEGFSYEGRSYAQNITSSPPSYTSRTSLALSVDKKISRTLYLRGFVGADYQDYQWLPPENEEWYVYGQAMGLSRQQAETVYTLPLHGAPAENLLSLTMEFPSAPGFSYLPLFSTGNSIFLSEDNRLPQGRTSRQISGQCFPVTLDDFQLLSAENLSRDSLDLLEAYSAFCRQRYTFWEEPVPEALEEELSRLPVYTSMPESPSGEDIQKAAEEIRNFLWDHASYSTSLESFSPDLPLCQELLYEQKKGFCTHFATVGTQLFRMYGIPARYVSGYSVPPELLKEDSQGGFLSMVPDSRAHAWVEVYTPEAGWVPVEVTPASQTSPASEESLSSVEETGEEAVPEETRETDEKKATSEAPDTAKDENSKADTEKAGPVPGALASVGKFLLLTVFLLGLLFLALLLVRRQLFLLRLAYFAKTPSQAYRIVFKNLIRLWELEFSIKIQTSTDREYFRLLSEKLPSPLKDEFAGLYADAEAFAYGQQKPSPSQLRSLRRYYLQQRKTFLQKSKKYGSLTAFLQSFRI